MRYVILIASLALAGCTKVIPVEAPAAPPAAPGSGSLRAGFARVDITPPPGGGLMGYGTEGARAQGHRMRLYARALVLEDPAGERFAFVLTDLLAVSAVVHRRTAMMLDTTLRIGADRLIVSATHTHSAPGHFNGAPAYDEQSSVVEGYDSAFVSRLARGIATAVEQAAGRMQEARAAWGTATLWGQTRVRDDVAARRNERRFVHPEAGSAPVPDESRYRNIDPQISMLRVDVRAGDSFTPAGSLIIFPVHGTLNPGANRLIDGDLHTIVMRELERGIGAAPTQPDGEPGTIHLFANGAEGDIVANFSAGTRCPAPAPRQGFAPTGPRRPPQTDHFRPVPAPPFPKCLQDSRAEAFAIGTAMAQAAVALHGRLADSIASPAAGQLRIARTFDVLSVSGGSNNVLCKPRLGPATIGGAEGGYSRFLNVPAFTFLLGIDTLPSGNTKLPARDDCDGGKRSIRLFEALVAGKRPYPTELQLTVVRIGDVTIGTVPGEATTNAGARMRRAMAADSNADFLSLYRKQLVIGLANGYVHYIASPHEYTAQLYEGAATLFGPYTAETIAQHLGRLARALPEPGQPSPQLGTLPPVNIAVRAFQNLVPRAGNAAVIERTLSTCWRGDTLIARWRDHTPGNLDPAAGKLLSIERATPNDTTTVTWDDDPFLEVWHRGNSGGAADWEMLYAPPQWHAGAHRITLRPRASMPAVQGNWVTPGQPRCR